MIIFFEFGRAWEYDPYLGGANPGGIWRRGIGPTSFLLSLAYATGRLQPWWCLTLFAGCICRSEPHIFITLLLFYLSRFFILAIVILIFLAKILTQEWSRAMDDLTRFLKGGCPSLIAGDSPNTKTNLPFMPQRYLYSVFYIVRIYSGKISLMITVSLSKMSLHGTLGYYKWRPKAKLR